MERISEVVLVADERHPDMLTLLATTLANYAPSVQQQTRLSMSRVTGVSQPIQDVVQQLRGGGESCDVILVTELVHKASPLYRASRSEPLRAGGLRRSQAWHGMVPRQADARGHVPLCEAHHDRGALLPRSRCGLAARQDVQRVGG